MADLMLDTFPIGGSQISQIQEIAQSLEFVDEAIGRALVKQDILDELIASRKDRDLYPTGQQIINLRKMGKDGILSQHFELSGKSAFESNEPLVILNLDGQTILLNEIGFVISRNVTQGAIIQRGPLSKLGIQLFDYEVSPLLRMQNFWFELGSLLWRKMLHYRELYHIFNKRPVRFRFIDRLCFALTVMYTTSVNDFTGLNKYLQYSYLIREEDYIDDKVIVVLKYLSIDIQYRDHISCMNLKLQDDVQIPIVITKPYTQHIYTHGENLFREEFIYTNNYTTTKRKIAWTHSPYPLCTNPMDVDTVIYGTTDELGVRGEPLVFDRYVDFPLELMRVKLGKRLNMDTSIHITNGVGPPHVMIYEKTVNSINKKLVKNIEYGIYIDMINDINLRNGNISVTNINRPIDVPWSTDVSPEYCDYVRMCAYGMVPRLFIQGERDISIVITTMKYIIDSYGAMSSYDTTNIKLWMEPNLYNKIIEIFPRALATVQPDLDNMKRPDNVNLIIQWEKFHGGRECETELDIESLIILNRDEVGDVPYQNLINELEAQGLMNNIPPLDNQDDDTMTSVITPNMMKPMDTLPNEMMLYRYPIFLPLEMNADFWNVQVEDIFNDNPDLRITYEQYISDDQDALRKEYDKVTNVRIRESSTKELSILDTVAKLGLLPETRGGVYYPGTQRGTLFTYFSTIKGQISPQILLNIIKNQNTCLSYRYNVELPERPTEIPNLDTDAWSYINWDPYELVKYPLTYKGLTENQKRTFQRSIIYGDFILKNYAYVMGRIGSFVKAFPEYENTNEYKTFSYEVFPITGTMWLSIMDSWNMRGLENRGVGSVGTFVTGKYPESCILSISDIQNNSSVGIETTVQYQDFVLNLSKKIVSSLVIGGIGVVKINYVGNDVFENIIFYNELRGLGLFGIIFPEGKKSRNMEGYLIFRRRGENNQNPIYNEHSLRRLILKHQEIQYLNYVKWCIQYISDFNANFGVLNLRVPGFYSFEIDASEYLNFNHQLTRLKAISNTCVMRAVIYGDDVMISVSGVKDELLIESCDGFPKLLYENGIIAPQFSVSSKTRELITSIKFDENVRIKHQRIMLEDNFNFNAIFMYAAGERDIFPSDMAFGTSYSITNAMTQRKFFRWQKFVERLKDWLQAQGISATSGLYGLDFVAGAVDNLSLRDKILSLRDEWHQVNLIYSFIPPEYYIRAYDRHLINDRVYGPFKWSGASTFLNNPRFQNTMPFGTQASWHGITELQDYMDINKVPYTPNVAHTMAEEIITGPIFVVEGI